MGQIDSKNHATRKSWSNFNDFKINTTQLTRRYSMKHFNEILKRKRKKELSSTFNVINNEPELRKINQININLASEEELMTLSGIDRSLAKSIVTYRNCIGGFRQVEDIALVSGIGAEKMLRIQDELFIDDIWKNNSIESVHTPTSCDSVQSNVSNYHQSSRQLVDINKANIFDLMSIPGINQKLASRIINCRDKYGSFKTVSDLLKIRGSRYQLAQIWPKLTIKQSNNYETVSVQNPPQNDKLYYRRSSSAPLQLPKDIDKKIDVNSFEEEYLRQLSCRSKRPDISNIFSGMYQGRSVFRLAVWNLEEISEDKMSNPGVQEVMCCTILENGISLIIFTGTVLNNKALQLICNEMNNPSLPHVKKWEGNIGFWKFDHKEELSEWSIFYNVKNCIQILQAQRIMQNSWIYLCIIYETLMAIICAQNKVTKNDLDEVKAVLKLWGKEEAVFVLLAGCNSDQFNYNWQHANDQPLKCSKNSLNLFSVTDNMWLDEKANALCTGLHGALDIILNCELGQFGMITSGLTHLAIPKKWKWGGPVSDWCPLWCEFYTHENCDFKKD